MALPLGWSGFHLRQIRPMLRLVSYSGPMLRSLPVFVGGSGASLAPSPSTLWRCPQAFSGGLLDDWCPSSLVLLLPAHPALTSSLNLGRKVSLALSRHSSWSRFSSTLLWGGARWRYFWSSLFIPRAAPHGGSFCRSSSSRSVLSSPSDLDVLSVLSSSGFSPNRLPLGFGLSAFALRFFRRAASPFLVCFRFVHSRSSVSDSMLRPLRRLFWPAPFDVGLRCFSGGRLRFFFRDLLHVAADVEYDAVILRGGVDDISSCGADVSSLDSTVDHVAAFFLLDVLRRGFILSTVCRTRRSDLDVLNVSRLIVDFVAFLETYSDSSPSSRASSSPLLATPEDVVKFLFSRGSWGETQVHSVGCPFLGISFLDSTVDHVADLLSSRRPSPGIVLSTICRTRRSGLDVLIASFASRPLIFSHPVVSWGQSGGPRFPRAS